VVKTAGIANPQHYCNLAKKRAEEVMAASFGSDHLALLLGSALILLFPCRSRVPCSWTSSRAAPTSTPTTTGLAPRCVCPPSHHVHVRTGMHMSGQTEETLLHTT
jgi:hypothetical protein